MNRSILLHALSLNDRILEPNQLPVNGHVWAFDKTDMSREMFVGNCISLLAFLGSQNARISWDNDIMAFDVQLDGGQQASVIISLQDDSLASDYYYFLGIWMASDSKRLSVIEQHDAFNDWEKEGLISPVLSYKVSVSNRRMSEKDIRKIINSAPFGNTIYHEKLAIYGKTDIHPYLTGRFVICPSQEDDVFDMPEIQHSLYSLRNLMSLSCKCMEIYASMQNDDLPAKLYQKTIEMMLKVNQQPVHSDWDMIVRENSLLTHTAASATVKSRKEKREVLSLARMFDSISSELVISEMGDIPSLFARLNQPFEFTQEFITNNLEMLQGADDQSQVLQSLLNARILASQQQLLQQLLQALSPDRKP
ncbi:MAG: hypothetical protein CO186_01965 [Zetaproteobacteria bacterium CG_4_9_14_3_um_filter_49_83]|nr:MAG: hypothetical protein AUJ56_01930 [Zetaproteobacteria bacterium CG1_02_49_23]PIQ34861.1 MAG: hypothetical protein COW62_00405 [Zetaproteobacteria bacterium CG17_big_fil_post_rev_8_21_14_2_50_50_13]PIV31173.1 MAG: hypothetical protein COS35_02670 [Zetaproteobacteria bacterium CG02_land_8_20_14_3_00_50_9]PIY55815.1 MAG: hypothetical protein COZ00_07665 [Zetaproteobacteria bacterium CG_4_10_14_0_8_um_filter_49_80]PJA36197.1 MAG: hypothetical protein CO186_01965 [Zetaproteobacteria bacterium